MESEYYIKKWLEGTLTEEERKVFEASPEFESLERLNRAVRAFRAPEYDVESELARLQENKKGKGKVVKVSWLKPLLRIAAVLVVLIGSYFFFYLNVNTTIETAVAEKSDLYLPDSSHVVLNAYTKIAFKPRLWNLQRQVNLDGEAFFEVAKGSKFDVKTSAGIVSVLGTKFNVKNRDGFFEVVCFEGLVEVESSGETNQLPPGHALRVINGKIYKRADLADTSPGWIKHESSFLSVPFKQVIREFERQYDVKVVTRGVNMEQLFTGKFTHDDLNLALRAISLPLNLKYEIVNGDKVILSGEK